MMPDWTPKERLERFLKIYHSKYTVNDVVLAETPGCLLTTIPCPQEGCPCASQVGGSRQDSFRHTLDIQWAGYPVRDEGGRFVSPYRLWNELRESGFPKADRDLSDVNGRVWVEGGASKTPSVHANLSIRTPNGEGRDVLVILRGALLTVKALDMEVPVPEYVTIAEIPLP